jgi:hypothetical protein
MQFLTEVVRGRQGERRAALDDAGIHALSLRMAHSNRAVRRLGTTHDEYSLHLVGAVPEALLKKAGPLRYRSRIALTSETVWRSGRISSRFRWWIVHNMILLTEGGASRLGFYKHRPPDGRRANTSLRRGDWGARVSKLFNSFSINEARNR